MCRQHPFVGVALMPDRKFAACKGHGPRHHHFGRFVCAEDAARAHDTYMRSRPKAPRPRLNFPCPSDIEPAPKQAHKRRQPAPQSEQVASRLSAPALPREPKVSAPPQARTFKHGFRGLTYSGGVYKIHLPAQSSVKGQYKTAEEAARAYDRELFYVRGPQGPFNFPDDLPGTAGYIGVVPSEGAFRAVGWRRLRTLDLGLYPTAEDAARAHDDFTAYYYPGNDGVLNFPPPD
jgi:hypothetical protein